MSVRMTLAPSRTKRWAAAPPKPMSSPLMAAAAPVSRAILDFSRILFSRFTVDRGRMHHFVSCFHRRTAVGLSYSVVFVSGNRRR